ncbi:MAG: hydrogenase, partial [Desulfuromonas sp.]
MDGYTDTIRRWAADTRHTGLLDPAHGTGEVGLGSEEAGRRLAVRFTLQIELEHIVDARFQVFGCGFTIAACAAAADLVIGETLHEAAAIDATRIDRLLDGLPSERDYCAKLAAEALQAAVSSAHSDQQPIQAKLAEEGEHGPRVHADDPLYLALSDTPCPEGISADDRHLFACLLTVATREPYPTASTLGLNDRELGRMLLTLFPAFDPSRLDDFTPESQQEPPEINLDVVKLLSSYHPHPCSDMANWLTAALAARAALTGHLWVAMGL